MTVLAEVGAQAASLGGEVHGQIDSYESWILHSEPAIFGTESESAKRLRGLRYQPLVSIILPTHNPNSLLLERSVQSVLDQRYTNWQLCIVSSDTTSSLDADLAALDDRIQLLDGGRGCGNAELLNKGLEKATGEFVLALGQTDALHASALRELVFRWSEHETCELIYSDEDQIDIYSSRSNPILKPEIDPEMLSSLDSIGRLAAYKREAISTLDGFKPPCEGSHDWDLALRFVERLGIEAVQHIAKPLYHRGSTDGAAMPPQRTLVRVLSEHVERNGIDATVEPGVFSGSLRLKHNVFPSSTTVFIRQEDGVFQMKAVLSSANRLKAISIHQLNESGSIATNIAGASGEVFVFINRPLESINHCFFEELVSQAMRLDCGLVSGISLNTEAPGLAQRLRLR